MQAFFLGFTQTHTHKKKKKHRKKKQVGDKYQTEDLSCKPVENTERNRVSSHLESAVKEKNKRKDSSFLTFFFFLLSAVKKKKNGHSFLPRSTIQTAFTKTVVSDLETRDVDSQVELAEIKGKKKGKRDGCTVKNSSTPTSQTEEELKKKKNRKMVETEACKCTKTNNSTNKRSQERKKKKKEKR